MTLHGTIEVNHQRIGYWYVQRIVTSQDGNHTYRWDARLHKRRVTGDLQHRYDDGAMVLASKVLTAAWEALAAKTATQEES